MALAIPLLAWLVMAGVSWLAVAVGCPTGGPLFGRALVTAALVAVLIGAAAGLELAYRSWLRAGRAGSLPVLALIVVAAVATVAIVWSRGPVFAADVCTMSR